MDLIKYSCIIFLLISAVSCQDDAAGVDGDEMANAGPGFGEDIFEDLTTDEPLPMERYEEKPPLYGPYEPPKDPEPLPEPQYVPTNPPPVYEKPKEPEYLPTKPPVYKEPTKPIPVKEEYPPTKEPEKSPCAQANYGGCAHAPICCMPVVCCFQVPTPAPYVPPKPVDQYRINWKALGRILLNPLIMPVHVASQAAAKGAAVPALGAVKGSLVSGALAAPVIVGANAAGPIGSAAVGVKFGVPKFLMNGLGRVHPYFKF